MKKMHIQHYMAACTHIVEKHVHQEVDLGNHRHIHEGRITCMACAYVCMKHIVQLQQKKNCLIILCL